MRLLRRVTFWLFVAAYLTVCPLIIAYALGYLFRPSAAGGLVRTGLLYLSTAPPGASVYLGNQRYTKQTPTVLRDLLPGEYPVRLVLKGYQPWTQTVPIEAEKATVLEHVLLLPQTLQSRILLPGPFEQLIQIPGTPLVLLTKGPKTDDVIVYSEKDAVSWPLLPPNSPFRGTKLLSHVTVRESPCVFLRVDTRQGEEFLWVTVKPEANRADDLTNLFPELPLQVAWDPLDRHVLFAFRDGHLNRLDVASKALYPRMVEHVLGFGVSEKTLYVLQDDGVIERMELDGSHAEVLPDETRLPRSLVGMRGPVQLRVLSKDTALVWGERGELLVNQFPYRLVDKGVLGLEVNAKRDRALVWEKDALGMITFPEGLGSAEFTGLPALRWILTRGNRIEQAFWAYEDSHILFRDTDRVRLLELEAYGSPHLYDLPQVKRKSAVAYSEATGTLYYLESATGALASLEIIPRQAIILLPFPERREERARRDEQAP